MSIDVKKIREDFPALNQEVYGKPLIYLDNGATTQKPQVVLDTIATYYTSKNSNIHRGVHCLSQHATEDYENSRQTAQQFINARHSHEIVFTSGTTQSINLIAFSYGEKYIHEGDEIVLSEMEHHANLVPWQLLAERKKAHIKIVPFNDQGILDIDAYKKIFSERTKIVAITHISNSMGTINPVSEIIAEAHGHDVPVLLDCAQSIQHEGVDVQKLDADFIAFSGHKIYGPTGIGVLYGKEKWLDKLPPYMGGGDMVDQVTLEKTTFNELPFKFEAGTTNYIGAAGLASALDYISNTGLDNIKTYEHELLEYAMKKIAGIEGITIYGQSPEKTSIISFLLDHIHQYDTGMILDKLGIAVRTGTHCTQPVMQHFGIEGTVRACLSFYNTKEEIDALIEGIKRVQMMFG